MKVLDQGHVYELRELGSSDTQTLTFIKRSGGAVEYVDQHPGLQTQEVLRALIDRTKYLYEVLPCSETEEALKHLRMSLYWYEVRALRRKKENVNRTTNKHIDTQTPAYQTTYPADISFTEHNIELYPIDSDGHIITD
jgi:hypothetical protein